MSTFVVGVHRVSSENPTVLTHTVGDNGWVKTKLTICEPSYKCIKHLGECTLEGDMFAAYTHTNEIVLYKGKAGNEFN